jgi:uncharacterized RDD family membrane protein YckC
MHPFILPEGTDSGSRASRSRCGSVTGVTEPERLGLLGRAAGALTGKMVETVPPDAVLERIDVNAVLDRVDINRLLDRVDMDRLLARIDADALLRNVDVESLVRRSGVPDLVAESTGRLAGGALDLARRQVVGLDTVIVGVVGTLLRRRRAGIDAGPPALRPTDGERDLHTVTGNYAGPTSRALASGIDAALMFVLFTLGVAGVDLLLGVFFGSTLQGRGDTLWSVLAAVAWVFAYVLITTVVAGRTPGKAIVGLRVVTSTGLAVTPGRALVRTVVLPIAAAALGLGLLPILLGRDRRGLHDLVAGTAVVYDWGDRPATMPVPLSTYLSHRLPA